MSRIIDIFLGQHIGRYVMPLLPINTVIMIGVEAGWFKGDWFEGCAKGFAISYIAVVCIGLYTKEYRE